MTRPGIEPRSPGPLANTLLISQSISSLVCRTLCIVINFFVFWSVCLSSSLVLLKNGLDYLTRWISQVSILLTWFLLKSLVAKMFLFFWGTLFLLFLSSLCDDVRFKYSKVFVVFLFFFIYLFFQVFWLDSFIPSIVSLFAFFHCKHGTFFNPKFYYYYYYYYYYKLVNKK